MIVHTRIKTCVGQWWAFKSISSTLRDFGVPGGAGDYYELAAIATVGDVMDLQERTGFW